MILKKILFLIILISNSFFAFAQSDTTSSSDGVDTNTVNSLLSLSKNNFGVDPLKAINYSYKALELSQKLNFKKGEAFALKNLGIANYYQGHNIEALGYYQKSLLVFQSMGDDNGISNIESNIGAIYMNQGNDTKALEYFLK